MFEPTESLIRAQRAVEASRFDEARLAYAKALEHEPESIDALRGLGYSLLQLGQLSGSLDALERALRLDPTDLLSCLLMGRLCLRLQQPQGAEVYFRAILERIAASEAARSGLIDALVAQDDLPAAREQSEEMLKAGPNSEVANLAAARLAGFEGDDARALQHFETLVRLRPGNPVHLYNRGLCLLRIGRFDDGWRDYELRFAAGAVNLRMPSTPRWDGRRVSRLLVLAEQGLGDSILFSRFVADAARRVDRLTLACPDSLVGLLGRSLGHPCVSERSESWPEHDAHVPLMSLPHTLGLGAGAAAPRPAYLAADPALQGRWSAALGSRADGRLRIGLVHATSVAHSTEENALTRRSCRAADLLPIVRIPGVEAYDLNLGKAAEEAREELPGLRRLPASIRDFDDTAAVIGLLDAVVSVDTACAHVAGAIGVPLFLLLPPVPDWKWRRGTPAAPWYQAAHPMESERRAGDGWIDVAVRALSRLQQEGARARG
jgi:Flp pilus assembly protein TadD